ncbi:methylmalonyl-CoA mutase family protein [Nocardiopsis coralliicola]
METPESREALGAGFPAATRAEWRERVAAVLEKSGVDADASEPEALLASATYDGITVSPLYTEEDGFDSGFPGLAPFTRGARADGSVRSGWQVRQLHADPDPAAARRAVLADLENGVGALWLRLGDGALPVSGLREALTDTYLDMAPVHLDAGADYAAAADEFLTLCSERELPDSALQGGLGIDPLGTAARTGAPAAVEPAAAAAAGYAAGRPGLLLMAADATPVHDAGGSEAQELGTAVAAGVAYLRALTEAGLGLDEAARRVEFRISASDDQFLTIAKLRAARSMWARVLDACGLAGGDAGGAAPPMRLHAVTSAAMMTRRDPYVNMLRTTLACFAAGVAGADAITVRPFDTALGLPDGFARRIARNTQTLLIEESHVARVIDPAGGAYLVERLTADLHDQGWAFLQEIEAQGGIAEALASGAVRRAVDGVWERRRAAIAHRTDPITGVSEYPDAAEVLLSRPAPPGTPAPRVPEAALPARRYGAEYEELRDAAEQHAAATGSRPRVFLATLGPVAAHTARASYAANLFTAGGIEPVGGAGADGPAEAAQNFAASGAAVACVCSSDAVYTEHAAAAAAALKDAGAVRVLLAGERVEEYADAGVDDFLHRGSDALGLLASLHATLGVGR